MSTPTMNRPRGGYTRSMSGLAGSLIAIFGLIAVMGGFAWLQHRPVQDPARTVDYTASLAVAREQSPFHILVPTPPPPELRATSVSWDGVGVRKSWHIGFVTPDQNYLGLYEGNGPASMFVEASTPASQPGPSVTVAGQLWQTLTDSSHGETALVRRAGGVTTVVTGTVGAAQVEAFVALLH